MKIKLLSCLLILLLAVPLMAAPPKGKSAVQTAPLTVTNTTYIDANRILMFVTNHGNFGRDLGGVFGNDFGTYWPYSTASAILDGSNKTSPYYAGGLWVGAVDSVSGDTLVCLSEYASEYVPGPMSGGTFQVDRPAFRVYKLYRDSLAGNPNQDYLDWPVDQGAPMAIDTTIDTISFDSVGDSLIESDTTYSDPYPWMQGDQMCWSVFNDANPDQHHGSVDAGETDPLGLEVKQTIFAFDRQGTLGDIVIIKLQVYNKGDRTLQHCFMSLWSDPDLGGSGDDLVGCDTLLDLGFCYNQFEADQKYKPSPPPCLGIDFFQGPLVFTDDEADTGRMWNKLWPGYENMGLYSFNKYINGTDPDNYQEAYMFMEGLRAKQAGAPYVYEGDTLLFQHSGDPVTGTGDLDDAGDDRRMMQTTGPVTFRPGDSVEIYAALIVGGGTSRLNSITVMKQLDDYAQKLYEAGFNPPTPPAKPVVTVANIDNEITLSWTDTSEVEQGDFRFEGYTVWQGESENGPWTELATYDVDNDRAMSLIDTFFNAYAGTKFPVAMRKIGNTGLHYRYTTTQDALNGWDLRNLTSYYFRVTAFSYAYWSDDSGTYVSAIGQVIPAGDRFLESETPVLVIPQSIVAGNTPQADPHDLLPVTHTAGGSGGTVEVEVVDPRALTGDTYRVVFVDTIGIAIDTTVDTSVTFDTLGVPDTAFDSTIDSINLAWHLLNVTTGDTLLWWQTNQTNDSAYQVIDGMFIRVLGPVGGIASFQVVANGAGVVDPPEAGAFPWYSFPTPTGVDPDGYPTDGQQVGDGLWGIHTGDNGGTCAGGNRYEYATFLDRSLRISEGGVNASRVGTYDWEMRFTGSYDDTTVGGGYIQDWYGDDDVFWVPFEIWRTGIGTPDDPSDDIRLLPLLLDSDDDGSYNLANWGCLTGTHGGGGEHSVSGGDNDPYTDWLYWQLPIDLTPGEAAFRAAEDSMLAGTLGSALFGGEVFARTVLVNWNGGADTSSFNQDLPEQGTIFRIVTDKPNTATDVFTFTAPMPEFAASEAGLDAIKAVPNPYYLFGPYDPAVGNSQIYFSHLPEKCTITIYNMVGDYINRIEKNDPSTSNAYWNVRTENNLPVASGIYIYVVDAPGFGQKIGKMAVFTEQQVLDIY